MQIELCPDIHKLQGIASGLAYLHSQEVVHADLKTVSRIIHSIQFSSVTISNVKKSKHNVLISSNDTPLLADFGLSLTLTESQTVNTTSTRGSLRWMSPELFGSGGEPSRHNKMSDIWAFGMLAYVRIRPCLGINFVSQYVNET